MRSVLIKKITTNASFNGWGYVQTASDPEEDAEKGIYIKLNQNIMKFQFPAFLDAGYRKHIKTRRILIITIGCFTIIFLIILILIILSLLSI